jgi:hypothetical protein
VVVGLRVRFHELRGCAARVTAAAKAPPRSTPPPPRSALVGLYCYI